MASNEQTWKRFFTRAGTVDFSRDFLFRVLNVNIVNDGKAIVTLNTDDLVYATAAKLPGREITMKEAKYMGVPLKIPGAASYENDYTVTFYTPMNNSLHKKLIYATRKHFNEMTDPVNSFGGVGAGAYKVPTMDSIIRLGLFDNRFNIVQEIELYGVSVSKVSSIEYKMADGDGAVVTFDATFTYHFFNENTRELTISIF